MKVSSEVFEQFEKFREQQQQKAKQDEALASLDSRTGSGAKVQQAATNSAYPRFVSEVGETFLQAITRRAKETKEVQEGGLLKVNF